MIRRARAGRIGTVIDAKLNAIVLFITVKTRMDTNKNTNGATEKAANFALPAKLDSAILKKLHRRAGIPALF